MAYYGDDCEINVAISPNIEKVDLKSVYMMEERPSVQLVKYLVNLKSTEAFALAQGNIERANEIKEWFLRFEQVLRSVYGIRLCAWILILKHFSLRLSKIIESHLILIPCQWDMQRYLILLVI